MYKIKLYSKAVCAKIIKHNISGCLMGFVLSFSVIICHFFEISGTQNAIVNSESQKVEGSLVGNLCEKFTSSELPAISEESFISDIKNISLSECVKEIASWIFYGLISLHDDPFFFYYETSWFYVDIRNLLFNHQLLILEADSALSGFDGVAAIIILLHVFLIRTLP